jgi:hypothetical protein
MFKKEDVDDDANDDDELRSSASQNHVTAALITKGFSSQDSVYISPLISAERCGGQEIDDQCNTYRWSQLGFQLPALPPYCIRFYKSIQLFCDCGRLIKLIFFIFSGDTLGLCCLGAWY